MVGLQAYMENKYTVCSLGLLFEISLYSALEETAWYPQRARDSVLTIHMASTPRPSDYSRICCSSEYIRVQNHN